MSFAWRAFSNSGSTYPQRQQRRHRRLRRCSRRFHTDRCTDSVTLPGMNSHASSAVNTRIETASGKAGSPCGATPSACSVDAGR